MKMKFILIFFSILLVSNLSFADEYATSKKLKANTSPETLRELNAEYKKTVEPIFKQKCFDCHSQNTVYPWYYNIPGVKQLIDSDIEEALEDVDMTNGFPFEGHHSTAEKQLDDLDEVLEENEMPPLQYKLIHWSSRLSKEDKALILDWIENSRAKLNLP